MTICILGRQPEFGLAELEALYGDTAVTPLGSECALVDAPVDFERLGGSTKMATLLATLSTTSLDVAIKQVRSLIPTLIDDHLTNGKIHLGLSTYGFDSTPYQLNGMALRLKKIIRSLGRSVRVVPNTHTALSSAQTFHNGLTRDNGIELIFIRTTTQTYIARVTAVQNINSYRERDRERPKRDAFVGMLPPKLAQIIINIATGTYGTLSSSAALSTHTTTANEHSPESSPLSILDPFCGTGVLLQEGLLMGYNVIGTDVSDKMVDYARHNLSWLNSTYHFSEQTFSVERGDATHYTWHLPPYSVIATETYLGQPLGGQQPTAERLEQIIHECNVLIRDFLRNISPQLTPHTRLCIAVPTWTINQHTHHCSIRNELASFGFERITFVHAPQGLLYRRDNQTTGRELIACIKQ